MKTITTLIMLAATCCVAVAGDRFVSTLGTVQREISGDRARFTLEIKATGKTTEESNAKLEQMMVDCRAQVAALNYPTSALTLKFRRVTRATEWNEEKRKSVPVGFDSTATFSVLLVGLTNYSAFLTYVGTNDGFSIAWQSMGSSAEGEARKDAIADALRAARAKAELLAAAGGATLGAVLEVTEEEVDTRAFGGSTWGGNASDPREGTGAFPIGIFVRVRAKFELNVK